MQKLAIVLGCVVLFAGALFLDTYFEQQQVEQLQRSSIAKSEANTTEEHVPNTELTLLNGQTKKLYSLKGHYVLVNFWATWCAPCLEEMPELLSLAQHKEELHLVLVSVDEAHHAIMPFFEKLGLTEAVKAQNVHLVTDADQQLAQLFQSFKYPESYLLTPTMALQQKFVGKVTAKGILKSLK